jgi:hypothetical protein
MKTRKKRIFAAGSVALPQEFKDHKSPYNLRSQVNSSFQGEIAGYNLVNLKIPLHNPPFNFFDFGQGKVFKQVGFKEHFDQLFILGEVTKGKFMAVYGNDGEGRVLWFEIRT